MSDTELMFDLVVYLLDSVVHQLMRSLDEVLDEVISRFDTEYTTIDLNSIIENYSNMSKFAI